LKHPFYQKWAKLSQSCFQNINKYCRVVLYTPLKGCIILLSTLKIGII
jgi:hypothetical protein